MGRENDDAGPTLLVISIVMGVIIILTTILRVTVRAQRKALGGDDYTIAAATCLSVGRIIIQIVSVPHGNGRHREFLSKSDYQYVNFCTWLTQLFLFPLLCLLKISVCLLVLRIKNTKPLRWGLWALISLLIATTLLPEIILLAECSPVSAYWTSQADKCWSPDIRIYSIYLQTAASVLADVVCTLLPIVVVWDLTLSLKNKIAVCGLMSLGIVSTCFACVRASSLGTSTSDLSWAYCWAAIWGDIELGFGILGANLALSRTYYDFFKKGVRGLSSYTKSGSRSNRDNGSNNYQLSTHTPKSGVFSRNDPYAAFDGHAPARGNVQIKSSRRDSSAGSDLSDEVPLGRGIKREIEFSVQDAETQSQYHYDDRRREPGQAV